MNWLWLWDASEFLTRGQCGTGWSSVAETDVSTGKFSDLVFLSGDCDSVFQAVSLQEDRAPRSRAVRPGYDVSPALRPVAPGQRRGLLLGSVPPVYLDRPLDRGRRCGGRVLDSEHRPLDGAAPRARICPVVQQGARREAGADRPDESGARPPQRDAQGADSGLEQSLQTNAWIREKIAVVEDLNKKLTDRELA